MNNKGTTDDGNEVDTTAADDDEADNDDADAYEEATDGDDSGDSSDNDADSDDELDSDDMADKGAAAAAGGGVVRTKPIIPTFTGEDNKIFEISTLAQEFIESFLGYCQHARITQDKKLDNLDQCLNHRSGQEVVPDRYKICGQWD